MYECGVWDFQFDYFDDADFVEAGRAVISSNGHSRVSMYSTIMVFSQFYYIDYDIMIWRVHSISIWRMPACHERVYATSPPGVPRGLMGADAILASSCAGSSTAPMGADAILAS